jgi:hypothetical protein
MVTGESRIRFEMRHFAVTRDLTDEGERLK